MLGRVLDLLGVILSVVVTSLPILPVAAVAVVLYVFWHRRRGRRVPRARVVGLLLLAVYLFGVFRITLYPHLSSFIYTGGWTAHHINLVPFDGVAQMAALARNGGFTTFLYNVAGNVILFVPLGLLAPLLWRAFAPFWRTLLLGLGGTLAIETIQYFTGGHADMDDVMLNTAGAVIGFLLWLLLSKALPRAAAKFRLAHVERLPAPRPGGREGRPGGSICE